MKHTESLGTALLIGSLAFSGASFAGGASGKALSYTCAGCHGTDGASVGPATPSLAGMSEAYIVDTMTSYKEGDRASTIMQRIAKGYTSEQIEQMAAYFAKLPVYKAKVPHDAKKAKSGAAIYDKGCAKCHDENGALPDDDAGILAGQWLPYLTYSMEDFQTGRREQPRKMKKKVDKLDSFDIDALMHYFASQQ